MPYADPERKKAYQKEYRARLQEAKTRAQAPPTRKVYFCSRFPHLKVGPVEFFDKFYVTDCPEQQRFIEGLEEYGRYIISWPALPGSSDNGSQDFIL
jgi:hypothetical protein